MIVNFSYLTLQVPLPEKPDTEDEILLKKWKWKVKSVKKENRERHSQRCDTELKLVVRTLHLPIKTVTVIYVLKELLKPFHW